ncbi:GNAT family N-acetyltransferase [Streptomyces sp. NPDC015350]|uniref:GNAT family N-acetyltransferase n=1 Tax=Streptomyces sp. NPDC015350 TaxID=3364955 RepID=UPI003701B916
MNNIRYRTGSYYGMPGTHHIWETAGEDGSVIAELYVSTDRAEIANVWVHEGHRGRGRARALYETAVARMEIFHAPAAHRTVEGDAFAAAVGGPVVAPYPCDCRTCDRTDEEENEETW